MCGSYLSGIDKIIEILSIYKPGPEFIPQFGIDIIPRYIKLPTGLNAIINFWYLKEFYDDSPIIETFFRGTSGAVFVFNHLDYESFKSLNLWFNFFRKFNEESSFLLIGINYRSEFKKITIEEAQNWAESKNGFYIGLEKISIQLIEDSIFKLLKEKI